MLVGNLMALRQTQVKRLLAYSSVAHIGYMLLGLGVAVMFQSADGAVGAFFKPKPFDLTSSTVQNLQDNDLFVVISQGFGVMPPFAENLSPEERWDVINYVRTLKK